MNYKPVTDEKFWKKLTKKEILHLLDVGVRDLIGLNNNFKVQQQDRERHNRLLELEPCWDCKCIARKLGAIE